MFACQVAALHAPDRQCRVGRLADTDVALDDKARACLPVGAILSKRNGFAVPIGERTLRSGADQAGTGKGVGGDGMNDDERTETARCHDLAGRLLFGCHMSFLDIDERLFELIELVEFDRSPLTDIKEVGDCDLGIIEGGLCMRKT